MLKTAAREALTLGGDKLAVDGVVLVENTALIQRTKKDNTSIRAMNCIRR